VRQLIAILAACAGVAMATGFQVQGNMSEAWDKSSLKIRTGEQPVKIWFGLPAHSGIAVAAKPDTGATVTASMNMSGTVDLRAFAEYTVEVTRDSGAGQWTCRDVAGGPELLGFGSSVDEKRHARLTYAADDDKETWKFTWPKEATFLVNLFGTSGKVVEEQDLYDNDEFELVGGGSFTLEIAPTEGSGEFTARKSE
jgi:hypothetical protein